MATPLRSLGKDRVPIRGLAGLTRRADVHHSGVGGGLTGPGSYVSDICSNPGSASRLAHEPREIVMPPAKKAAPAAKKSVATAKAAPQMTVTLKHLAAALSDNHDLPKKQAEAVLGDLVTLTTRHLKKGDKIRLNGLGILQVRKRVARMGRNPTTGEAIRSKPARRLRSGQPRN